MSDYSTLSYKVSEGIGHITLNRPEKLNSIDALAHSEMLQVLTAVKQDSAVRAVIIAAQGKCFSAGGDFDYIRALHESPQENRETIKDAIAIVSTLIDIQVPVIAAVQGDAIGFGASLAFGCDIVVSQPGVRFADPHVSVGLAAGDGGCLFWPQAAGILRAKRYLLTGDYLPASKAYEFGLVTDLVDTPEQVLPLAQKLAAKIDALAPLAVQGTKRSLNKLMQARAAEVVELAALYEQQTIASKDVVEAVNAIQEKRVPEYKGE